MTDLHFQTFERSSPRNLRTVLALVEKVPESGDLILMDRRDQRLRRLRGSECRMAMPEGKCQILHVQRYLIQSFLPLACGSCCERFSTEEHLLDPKWVMSMGLSMREEHRVGEV